MTDPENNRLPRTVIKEEDIDLILLAKEVWNGRKLVLKTVLVFILLGLMIAIFSPKEYQVTTIMVPQSSGNSLKSRLGGLSSLAAMAGFNLNLNSSSELSPMIYPQIVQSVPFQKALMQTKLDIKGIDHPVTYYNYYTKHARKSMLRYIFGFPGMILKALHGKQENTAGTDTIHILSLTPKERRLTRLLNTKVYADVDVKSGYITLTAIMPQPLAAAEMAQRAQKLLQEFITQIKIKKAKAQLDFIKGRYDAKKKLYDRAQMELANFQDQNKNISSATAATEQTRLTNDYQLAYGVYSQLAQELENAQIQVKDDTPVFSIIQPVTIPNYRYKPKRVIIMIIWTLLGLVVGIGLVIGKRYWMEVKERWMNRSEVEDNKDKRL